MTRNIKQKNYIVPQDLKFNLEDLLKSNGLKCYKKIDAKYYQDILRAPNKIVEVGVSLKFSIVNKDILVMGKIIGKVKLQCSRCLAVFDRDFKEEFTEIFTISSGEIDIMDIVVQNLVIQEEIQPLCNKSCKGLCQMCGSNLNVGKCRCKVETSSPFSVLKDKFRQYKK